MNNNGKSLSPGAARKILDRRFTGGDDGNGGSPLRPAQAEPERVPLAPISVVIAAKTLAMAERGNIFVPA